LGLFSPKNFGELEEAVEMIDPLDCTLLDRFRSSFWTMSWLGEGTTEFLSMLSLSFLFSREVGFLILL